MNSKSIFKTIQMLSILTVGIFVNAQSLNFTSPIPGGIAAGDTATFNYNYTSSVPSRVDIYLFKSVADGSQPDYTNGDVHIGQSVTGLPASTSASAPMTINIPIPDGTTTSANLGGSYVYYWTYFLKKDDGTYTYLAGSASKTTILAKGTPPTVSNFVAFNGTPPASVRAGSSQNVNFKYTSNVSTNDNIVKVTMVLNNGAGYNDVPNTAYYLNPAPNTTTTPVTGVAAITIPAATATSASLPAGSYYQWIVTIYDKSFSYITASAAPVTVTSATLGIVDAKNIKNAVYPNPVKDVVNFTKSSEVKTVKITDLSGRMILNQTKNFTNGLNVSNLKKGIYIITVNGNESQKLIKN